MLNVYPIEEVITSLIWCSCMTQLLGISIANGLKEENVKRGSVHVVSAIIWTITVANRVLRRKSRIHWMTLSGSSSLILCDCSSEATFSESCVSEVLWLIVVFTVAHCLQLHPDERTLPLFYIKTVFVEIYALSNRIGYLCFRGSWFCTVRKPLF